MTPWPAALPAPYQRAGFAPMTAEVLDLVAEVDKTAYAHPWSRRHFADSLESGHAMQMLALTPDPRSDPPSWACAPVLPDGRWLLGYLVAMQGVGEVHLLNLTTVPLHQRQGWARRMLAALGDWARSLGAHAVWLEVRASNQAAQALYASSGFEAVGVRKGYYPDHGARREDAIVMRGHVDALH
ncbi:GNAT family N-acetyltransferase [Tepidicella baoligensis]|uniref:GNAT family N-acetyltransferase n=1 Tax=Tepidicella baoligensis TaxID=2707016 RepID=UPI0015DA7C8F|nr:GNAT family N-acetyltransferase [Tepidicella baoligensis]